MAVPFKKKDDDGKSKSPRKDDDRDDDRRDEKSSKDSGKSDAKSRRDDFFRKKDKDDDSRDDNPPVKDDEESDDPDAKDAKDFGKTPIRKDKGPMDPAKPNDVADDSVMPSIGRSEVQINPSLKPANPNKNGNMAVESRYRKNRYMMVGEALSKASHRSYQRKLRHYQEMVGRSNINLMAAHHKFLKDKYSAYKQQYRLASESRANADGRDISELMGLDTALHSGPASGRRAAIIRHRIKIHKDMMQHRRKGEHGAARIAKAFKDIANGQGDHNPEHLRDPSCRKGIKRIPRDHEKVVYNTHCETRERGEPDVGTATAKAADHRYRIGNAADQKKSRMLSKAKAAGKKMFREEDLQELYGKGRVHDIAKYHHRVGQAAAQKRFRLLDRNNNVSDKTSEKSRRLLGMAADRRARVNHANAIMDVMNAKHVREDLAELHGKDSLSRIQSYHQEKHYSDIENHGISGARRMPAFAKVKRANNLVSRAAIMNQMHGLRARLRDNKRGLD